MALDWYDPQALFEVTRQWMIANPHWAGLATFVIAAAESLAVVGILVPGIAIFFAIGSLIGIDVLDFWPILLWAIAGAVVGDNISFWLGKTFKTRLWHIWPLSKYPDLPESGAQFFQKHGGKSIIFGRFVGPIRAIVPAVAGMSNMSGRYFLLVNVFSAILWAPVILLPGVLFGEAAQKAQAFFPELLLLMAAFFGLLNIWMWLVKRWYRPAQPLAWLPKAVVSLCVLLVIAGAIGWFWWQWREPDFNKLNTVEPQVATAMPVFEPRLNDIQWLQSRHFYGAL